MLPFNFLPRSFSLSLSAFKQDPENVSYGVNEDEDGFDADEEETQEDEETQDNNNHNSLTEKQELSRAYGEEDEV